MNKKNYPEASYRKTNLETINIIPYETEVVGTVTRFDIQRRELIVDLGFDWYGIIPELDVSVYDFTYPENGDIPHQVISIIGNQINAVVIETIGPKTLRLSRRQSMIRAWYDLEEGSIINACITHNIGYGIFLDIGNGLIGYSGKRDCSPVLISNTYIWHKVGDFVKIKLLSKGDRVNSRLICSHRLAYPSVEETINLGDVISVRVGKEQVEKGYLCQVTPRIPGIIDTEIELHEGEVVKGVVKKVNEKGFKLNFIA